MPHHIRPFINPVWTAVFDIHLKLGELFSPCVSYSTVSLELNDCVAVFCRDGGVFPLILDVLATQKIVFRCHRTNEKRVPFQWLIMAELSVFL